MKNSNTSEEAYWLSSDLNRRVQKREITKTKTSKAENTMEEDGVEIKFLKHAEIYQMNGEITHSIIYSDFGTKEKNYFVVNTHLNGTIVRTV